MPYLSPPTSTLPTPTSPPTTPTEPPASPGCGDYGLPTSTPRLSGDAVVGATLFTCADWQSELEPVVIAVNKDKKDFCSSYSGGSGDATFVINLALGADPAAKARIEALIPSGAPVAWREVKYSWNDLAGLMSSAKFLGIVEKSGVVPMYELDVISDTVKVSTLGEQAQVTDELEEAFGDMVTVVVTKDPPVTL